MQTDNRASYDITLVTVTHNSMAVLPDMLASVPKGVKVVIVDNASDAAALSKLRQLTAARGATLLENKENKGFGVACNQGAAGAETAYLLFLNPDARLGAGALEAFLEGAARYPDASAFNPRISNADGTPYFKRSSVLLPAGASLPRGWPAQDREVPILTGAALFVRREGFETVGGFDPAIFLFHEDDDLALRLKRTCGPLMFLRDAEVTHASGTSSRRTAASAGFKAYHMGMSRVYAVRKHDVPGEPRAAFRQALLKMMSPENLLSRRRRAKNYGFLRGVLRETRTPLLGRREI
ncbi:glycosyltransferase family 2 protein [Tropicimonas sp. S265A]|uniref:glycosyltransferase family 2 protein n=1 Tax=Tropicimonas sp. S265A TaxID=3415134 RepID=UPI003C7DB2B0